MVHGLELQVLKSSKNISELLEDQELSDISRKIISDYEEDVDSRAEWHILITKALQIAKQVQNSKNEPWPNASNVQLPLMTQGSIDFASRVFPEIIKSGNVVKSVIIGKDEDGKKRDRALRVSKYMTYDLIHRTDEWEDDMDKLLHVLPIFGTVFKKTYFDPIKERTVSELCNSFKIVLNNNVASLESARRVTHVINLDKNDIIERIRVGIFRDINLDKLYEADTSELEDEQTSVVLLEQHCYVDLDGDGYKEPYIVTLHQASGQILRIVNRFKRIKRNNKGEIRSIEPKLYFTDYHFIKSMDGGFYSIGLAALLYPLNNVANTLVNQLIDAGTLNNSQSGILGRGIRMKGGELKFRMGEYKVVDAAPGTKLADNVYQFPTKEPSPTLFQLLGLVLEMSKDLISATDIMQGKQPAQNAPATTVLTLVEQGLKIFNSITKRLYRSLRKELRKIYENHSVFLKDLEYTKILDEDASVKDDFALEGIDILPIADPGMSSDAQRLAKAQALISIPGLNQVEQIKYYLESLQLDKDLIEKLLPNEEELNQPKPDDLKTDAETGLLKAETIKTQVEAQVLSEKNVLEANKIEINKTQSEALSAEAIARIRKMEHDALNNSEKVDLATAKAAHEGKMKELDLLHKRDKDTFDGLVDLMDKQKKDED